MEHHWWNVGQATP